MLEIVVSADAVILIIRRSSEEQDTRGTAAEVIAGRKNRMKHCIL